MISVTQFNNFVKDFYADQYPGQRIGQAFLNEFHEDEDVRKLRAGPDFWEENTGWQLYLKLYSLGLIKEEEKHENF